MLILAAGTHPALSAAPLAPTRSDEGVKAQAPRDAPALALVLPLASATYGRVSAAVRGGFLAAAAAANAHPLVISHGDNDVETAFDQAREAGVRVIVGPLVRDDVKAIAIMGVDSPLVLALNQVDEGATLPPNMFSLTLGVESDGTAARADRARFGRAHGRRHRRRHAARRSGLPPHLRTPGLRREAPLRSRCISTAHPRCCCC